MSHDLDACGEHLKDVEGAILVLHTHREGRTQKSLTAFLWGPVQFSCTMLLPNATQFQSSRLELLKTVIHTKDLSWQHQLAQCKASPHANCCMMVRIGMMPSFLTHHRVSLSCSSILRVHSMCMLAACHTVMKGTCKLSPPETEF